MNSLSFKKLFPKKKREVRSVRQFVNPYREWAISLMVTFLIGCGLVAYAGMEFYRQYTDSDRPIVSEEHIPRYRDVDAELLIRHYERREREFNEARNLSVTENPVERSVEPEKSESVPVPVAGEPRAE